MIRNRLAAVILAACVCLPLSPSAREQQKPSMAGYPAVGAPATTKLIAPGAEPRRALRYAIPATYKGAMTMKTSIEMAGLPMPMPPMGMVMGVDVAVTSIAANGDISTSMVFTKAAADAGADPTIAAALQQGLAGIVGLKGTAVMTNRGVTKSVKLDLDSVKDPAMGQAMSQMSQSLENLLAPFPEEPIGVGARWESRSSLDANGMAIFQRAEYEVTAMTASSISVRVKLEQTAPQQAISNPMMPAEVQMSLDRMTGSGTATGTIPLNALVPTMNMDMSMTMSMTVNAAGQTLPISMEMKMKTSLAPGGGK